MKIILFDFDGVIVDTFSFCYRIIDSRDSLSESEYRARFEGNINAAPKKTPQDPNAKPFDFQGQYLTELLNCQPNKEIKTVIQELAKDHTLIIISSTISPSIAQYLEVIGLRGCFAEILGNDVEKSKVKKIQSVLERYAVKPMETVFITDTLGDIKEASECGVRSIGVTWGYHSKETLEQGKPCRIVERPEEIPMEIKRIEAGK